MADEEQQPLTLETYHPPLSLWKLVEQHVPKGEQEEVKSMLGYALVELSLDLHQEVETMLEIWQECKASNKLRLAQPRLPEPPAIRDRLVQEICFFVQNVKDKARSKGMDADHIFSKHNTEVIDYALHTSRGGGSGTSSPCDTQRSVSRSSSRASVDLTGEVSSMSRQLNVRHFNEVTAHLREYLESEIKQLKQDVELLQQCVVDEKDEMDGFRPASSLTREPTISELREERTSLEKEWLSQEKLPMSPPQSSAGRPGSRAGTHEDDSHACLPASVLVVNAPGMVAKPTQPQDTAGTSHQHSSSGCRPSQAKAKNLGTKPLAASRLRPIQAEAKAQSSRPGPMRASHAIPAARAVSPTDSIHSSSSSSTDVSESDSLTRAGGDAPRQPDTHLARADSRPSEASHGVPFRRRTISPSRVKVVPLGSVVSPQPSEPSTFSPTPPPSAKPNRSRPGSAQRFRNMVMDCREGQ